MRLKILLVSFLLFISSDFFAQSKDQKEKLENLHFLIQSLHVSPPEFNNDVSSEIFTLYLERIDPSRIYFTADDISILKPYVTGLDDMLQGAETDFFQKLTYLFSLRLNKADSIISDILGKPLKFSPKDTLKFYYSGHRHFCADEAELRNLWERILKYRVLQRWNQTADSASKKTATISLGADIDLRKKVMQKEKSKIQRIREHNDGLEGFLFNHFLNAVTARCDPHSTYFSLSEKKGFDKSLSSRSMSFGFSLIENEKEEVELGSLFPGGPAWKSNQLHQGDIILSVGESESSLKDVSALSLIEIEAILNHHNSQNLSLEVRKKTGENKVVSISQENLTNEENIVRSFILKGKRKVGYVTLPGFYSDYGNNPGCANDVAREILKLQKEGIEGLILDLRFNGGGSLKEALDLVGLFIDEGPLFIHSNKKDKPRLLKDMNRGTVYDGPLLTLVNGFSASASEFFAEAIQDYNRGLVAGSRTYGKATSQIVLPLQKGMIDPETQTANDASEKGFVKITINRFYRVTGKSHQKSGVIPDIPLPDFTSRDYLHESAEPFALSRDSVIKPVIYNKLPFDFNSVRSAFDKRTAADPGFKKIRALSDSLSASFSNGVDFCLTTKGYLAAISKSDDLNYRMSSLTNETHDLFILENNLYDQEVFSMNSFKKELNESVLETLREDIYLKEAYRIVSDMISLISN